MSETTNPLEAELEQVRKKREEAQQRNADRHEADRLAREIEAERRELLREELRAEFEGSLGEEGKAWSFVPCGQGVVAVRCPHFLVWQQYRDDGMKNNTTGKENLLFRSKGEGCCVIHPKLRAEFTELNKREPGLLDAAYDEVIRLTTPMVNERMGK